MLMVSDVWNEMKIQRKIKMNTYSIYAMFREKKGADPKKELMAEGVRERDVGAVSEIAWEKAASHCSDENSKLGIRIMAIKEKRKQ